MLLVIFFTTTFHSYLLLPVVIIPLGEHSYVYMFQAIYTYNVATLTYLL